MKNEGYAAPFNPRAVELVLRNVSDQTTYVLPLDVDPRKWKPEMESTIGIEAGLPTDMPIGDYDINPDYSIQLANEGVWEAETGYNSLLMRINVTSDEKTDIYNGDLVFTKK